MLELWLALANLREALCQALGASSFEDVGSGVIASLVEGLGAIETVADSADSNDVASALGAADKSLRRALARRDRRRQAFETAVEAAEAALLSASEELRRRLEKPGSKRRRAPRRF
jgi:hypothetical protein